MNLPTDDFLPHSTPMLWAKTLTQIDETSVTCESKISDDFLPFLDSVGNFPATLFIEIMAQTIGVWAGFQDKSNGRPKQSGLLLGCRNFAPNVDSVPFDSTVKIRAEKIVQDEFTGVFDAKAFYGDSCVAHATITTIQVSWENLDKLLTTQQ